MKVKGGYWRERLWEESFQTGAAVWFVEVVAVLGKQQVGEKKMGGTAVRKMWDLKWWGSLALWFWERKIQGPQGSRFKTSRGRRRRLGFFLVGERVGF